jgi:hypothetical protein
LSGGVYRLMIRHPSETANRFRRTTFRGFNKCNLFALDLAWRSGFRVPLLNIGTRSRPRYSYPLANMLASYAERAYRRPDSALLGSDGTQWGTVVTRTPAARINEEIARGALYVLAGWRASGVGHVGIINRIISKLDDIGRIRTITFDGWEATSRRAELLNGRRWSTDLCSQFTVPCGQRYPRGTKLLRVFCALHIKFDFRYDAPERTDEERRDLLIDQTEGKRPMLRDSRRA